MSIMDDVCSKAQVITKLRRWGYLPASGAVSSRNLKTAIWTYQSMTGLKADGICGPKTSRQIRNPFRCGVKDILPARDAICKWPHDQVSYTTRINLPGLSIEQAAEAFDMAAASWSAICGINFVRVSAIRGSNIVARSGMGRKNDLDGAGGTLAWSYLPCGAKETSQLRQMYDEAEQWNMPMALAVMAHELGHAAGLDHDVKGQLMAAYYDETVLTPQSGDIEEAVKRYGPAVVRPSVDVRGTFTINGIPFRVERA